MTLEFVKCKEMMHLHSDRMRPEHALAAGCNLPVNAHLPCAAGIVLLHR